MRRREFSPDTRRQALIRSKGFCECHRVPQLPTFGVGCGVKLSIGNIYFEHIVCDALDGDNSIDNCAALTKTCWRAKSYAYDIPVIAKVKRQRDKSFGIRRSLYRPIPGTKASGIRKPLRPFADPIDRRTGQPIGRGR